LGASIGATVRSGIGTTLGAGAGAGHRPELIDLCAIYLLRAPWAFPHDYFASLRIELCPSVNNTAAWVFPGNVEPRTLSTGAVGEVDRRLAAPVVRTDIEAPAVRNGCIEVVVPIRHVHVALAAGRWCHLDAAFVVGPEGRPVVLAGSGARPHGHARSAVGVDGHRVVGIVASLVGVARPGDTVRVELRN
jgi:hypothetical protein